MKRNILLAALAVAAIALLCVDAHVMTALAHYSSGLAAPAAMAMFAAPASSFRGIQRVRADANDDPVKVFNELRRTVEAFKAEQEKALADIRKKVDDPVQTEKVERINADISRHTAALDEINAAIAALKLGGGGGGAPNADVQAHAHAFESYFRRDVKDGLRDLEVKAGLTSQSNPDGGFVVPTTMEATIDRVLGTVSALRSASRVITISTGSYTKDVNMGGAGAGWVGEEDARTETETPKLKSTEFPVAELYAEPYATQIVLDDARIDIEQWLADEVSTTFAEMEGASFITGNGVKKPRGLLSYDMVANASYAWGKLGFIVSGAAAAFATSAPADALIEVFHALKAGYRNNANWLMSDVTVGSLRKMKDGQGNYLWAPPTTPEAPSTILGKPVITDDNMPSVAANAFPIAFGDFQRGYLVIDRAGIRVLRNPYKVNGKVAFYTTKRVGGGVQNFEAIKLLKIST
ncbi:phage major capsid protein [Ancylobacter vacuolatus]|uniref:HK97 family phage major capsid protein n=1 Tax=Ancylobacter vacuolatus TaxID=223389 RepID=A0ABU0DMS1_9HYPH|nr:phage major capsid protein [Ancylobacter vacuolatus]MDQ0349743.1 HK97 family phage major capsid protein [Ancylobacter vacuolatus]